MAPTLRRGFEFALGSASVVGAALLAWMLADVLVMAFAGTLLAILLSQVSRFIQRLGLSSYTAALLLVVVVGLSAVCLASLFAAGPLAEQAGRLGEEFPNMWEDARQTATAWGIPVPKVAGSDVAKSIPAMFAAAGNVLNGAAQLVLVAAVVWILGFFFALNPDRYRAGLLLFFPKKHRDHLSETLDEMTATLWRWLLGRAVAMVAVGALSAVAMWVLGLPFVWLLACIAGLLNFIPAIGPILGAVPALFVAASQGPATVLWTVALFTLIQQVENNLITPFVQRSMVDLPPATIVLSQLIAGVLVGPLGVAMAVPLAAAGKVIVMRYWLAPEAERHT